MKICHLADTHLGSGENHPRRGESGLTLRQEDIVNGFVEAIDRIIQIKPDVCIHAGDIFDKVRPSNRILAIAGEQLHRLAQLNSIPTIIIAGNHDAPRRLFEGAALEVYQNIKNLRIAASGALERFRFGETEFFALPHCLTTTVLHEELAKCVPTREAAHNVLILHGVAAGMPEFSMADLGEQELPLDRLSGFDYTALGHFHNYCQVGERAWYSGSTERLSQSEREVAKGFLEIDLDPYNVKFHPVTTREMVDIQTINGSGKRGDEIVREIEEKLGQLDSKDKIVRVSVKNVSEETLKTMPTSVLNDLKRSSFSLNVRFEKKKSEKSELPLLGKEAGSGLERGFMEFLERADLTGFKLERMKKEARKYLSTDEH
ncbi:MAG: exonuclease SbcCD subunit D [bacterium]|nr:exonuclease SbcCD subunit D [bacterium]